MKKSLKYVIFFLFSIAGNSKLFAQTDGKFYSLLSAGGAGMGTINVFDPLNNSDTAAVDFTGPNGNSAYVSNFIQLKDGNLYGMTAFGGNGNGNIIRYSIQTGKDSVLYNLPSNGDSGQFIYGSLCHATNDLLYGMTYEGGTIYGSGVLFSFDYHTGTYRVLVQFRGATIGAYPTGTPIQVTDSLLYGQTSYNNEYGYNTGTLFKYNIYTGDTTRVYTFTGGADGGYPRGSLIKASNGLLYGLTLLGGTHDNGVLFSFNTTTNTETVLVNFGAGTNGSYPEESLLQASDSNLYGTTKNGGLYGAGTLFRYNIATNTETVLYNFNNAFDTDGAYPITDLIQASDGLLYGNTFVSGTYGYGTIYSYNLASNTKKTLYSYTNATGTYPYGDPFEAMSANVSVVNNHCPNDVSGSLTVNVRGGDPPFTYLWSTGATTSSISNLASGIYYDTVWDSRGIGFPSIDTVKPLPMVLTFNVSNPCYDTNNGVAAVNVSGGIGPFTYLWSTGETTDTIYNLSNGTYTCTIKDSDGCPATNTVVISQATPLVIDSIVPEEQTYPYNNGSVTVYVKGGIPPGDSACYLYLWSNGGPDSAKITNLDSGTYAVCVTSCYGCGSACSDSAVVLTGTKKFANPANLITIYPVPSNGLINLKLAGNNFENIEITDALGRPVYKKLLNSQLIENIQQIDLSAQPNGVYILYVASQQGILTRKIIIQK